MTESGNGNGQLRIVCLGERMPALLAVNDERRPRKALATNDGQFQRPDCRPSRHSLRGRGSLQRVEVGRAMMRALGNKGAGESK